MPLPPASNLRACLAVLSHACLEARLLGWRGSAGGLRPSDFTELAALMDAVHNVPELILNWERCDEQLLRKVLDDFDENYRHGTRPLRSVYDEAGSDRGPTTA